MHRAGFALPESAKPNRAIYDLDMLRAVVMVADCGSFTTAAARLHSTQSTVSQKAAPAVVRVSRSLPFSARRQSSQGARKA